MKTKNTKKRLGIWAIVVSAILMIPVLAKFPWTTGDYIFAGVVLFGAATAYELTTKKMRNKTNRIAVAVAVLTVVFIIWGIAVS